MSISFFVLLFNRLLAGLVAFENTPFRVQLSFSRVEIIIFLSLPLPACCHFCPLAVRSPFTVALHPMKKMKGSQRVNRGRKQRKKWPSRIAEATKQFTVGFRTTRPQWRAGEKSNTNKKNQKNSARKSTAGCNYKEKEGKGREEKRKVDLT